MNEAKFEVRELSPSESLLADETFDDEDQALDVARSWGASGPWTQVIRVEGDARVCMVAEHNVPAGP